MLGWERALPPCYRDETAALVGSNRNLDKRGMRYGRRSRSVSGRPRAGPKTGDKPDRSA